MTMRTSSGVARISTEVIIELMNADLLSSRRTGDEHVGHLREVGHDVAALDVLAHSHHHRVLGAACCVGAHDVAKRYDFLVPVGDLDADR